MKPEPFRFECTACGRCCTWGGWVCLYPDDIRALAAHLGMSLQDFADTHTRHIGVEYANPDGVDVVPYLALKMETDTCPFLDGTICRVHAAKPYQCAASPLMAEFLLEPDGWRSFTENCEGMGRGPLMTRAMIDKALDEQATRDLNYECDLAQHEGSLAALLGVVLPEPDRIPDMGVEIDVE